MQCLFHCMMWQSFWKLIWEEEADLCGSHHLSCPSLAPPPAQWLFQRKEKNGEASSESWDLVRNILEWSEDLPDFESSTLQVTACFS